MAAWNINVTAVNAILKRSDTELADTEPAKDDVNSTLLSVHSLLGSSCPDVASAVEVLRNEIILDDMIDIMAQVNNAVQGVGQAVQGYLAGDDKMRDDAQQMAASIAPESAFDRNPLAEGMFDFGIRDRTVAR